MVVSILSFNHPQHTSRAVESVLRHYPAERVHLTHNGSRREVADELRRKFPSVRHFYLEENRGFTGGANAALRAGFEVSPWVLFVTNDCELMKAPADMGSLVPGLYAPKVYRRKIPVVDSIGGVFYPYLRRL